MVKIVFKNVQALPNFISNFQKSHLVLCGLQGTQLVSQSQDHHLSIRITTYMLPVYYSRRETAMQSPFLGKNFAAVHKLCNTCVDPMCVGMSSILNLSMHVWVTFSNMQFCQGCSLLYLLFLIFNSQGIVYMCNAHSGLLR